MITTVLYILLALAFLVIAACLVVWAIQREPAGHGQHATRRSIDRSLDLDWDKLPCFQPDPALAVATLHNPGLLDDIRAERTRNLHRPGAGATADNHRPVELNLAGQVSVAGPLPGELHLEDTAVDMSLHAAIRADVDGDYTGQITDRYFSVISLPRIFADLGITYTRTAVNA